MQSVTLLGTGTMGAGMAGRLLQAGHRLTVWNRNAARAEPFAAQGARLAQTPRDAAAEAQVIIAMLADDTASRSVWLGPEGALEAAEPGAVLIECSTLTTGWIRELAAAASARGLAFLDAPVTGSRTQAANGELLFLVGGEAAVLEQVSPVLSAMSRGSVHLGPAGSGALLKLINNFVCGVQVTALAEALVLIERGGLNREQAVSILAEGAPGSPLVKGVSQRMMAADYGVHFKLHLMRKDLAYALAEGERLQVPLATAGAALQVFSQADQQGLGSQDIAALIEAIRP